MKNPILVPEIKELLKNKRYDVLENFFQEGHAKEIAEYIEMLDPDEIWQILSFLDEYRRGEVFTYFDIDVQIEMVSGTRKKIITDLLIEMSPDDRADLFQHLKKKVVDRLMPLLPIQERSDIITLTSYGESTAGSIMTTDFVTLNENDTVEKSIKTVRKEAPSKETIYYIYVTDDIGKLIGFLSLRRLILARPKQMIKNLMKREVIFGYTEDDQEKVASIIEEYDLLALPIVDRKARLAGIVTYDDAIDIIREEQTEDLEKLMAISGGVEEKSYLEVPAMVHFRKRVFWIVVLGIFGLVTSLIIEAFQSTLETLIILTFYMPLLNAAGGNTGSQSSTVVLRSIALNELVPGDILNVIKKEFIVSSMLSLCLGVITFMRVYFLASVDSIPQSFTILNISLVISISLALQVLWATVFGAIVPIAATKLKLDPAVVSSPLLTTFVDMGGIIIYFTIAKIILGI